MDEWILSIFVIYLIYPLKTYKITNQEISLNLVLVLEKKICIFSNTVPYIIVVLFSCFLSL